MTAGRFEPPRVARAILEWAARRLQTSELATDAEELFALRVGREGRRRARAWYRRQASAALLRSLWAWPRLDRGSGPNAPFSSLDLKLGLRMLWKHPALTVVGTVALAVAIGVVAGFYAITEAFLDPELPVPEGDRVVAIWNRDLETGRIGSQTLGDVLRWQSELESVRNIGTFVGEQRVLVGAGGRTLSVHAARISPSAFEMLQVPPLLGRPLGASDALLGAEPVVLLGYDLWRSAFSGDAEILGRTVRIGGDAHTIIGVMPEGFGFPFRESLWTPLAIPTATLEPGTGAAVAFSFGRLVEGASIEDTSAEIAVLGERLASEHSETHRNLRPQVAPYTQSFIGADEPEALTVLAFARALILIVLLIAAVNVGALVYARGVAREAEVAVRTALGATRMRIVSQLFAEAVVLAGVAGLAGTVIVFMAVDRIDSLFNAPAFGEDIPFWFQAQVTPSTLVLVGCLAALAAIVTGVLPALKITRHTNHRSFRQASGGGGTRGFGKSASVVIVSQVAISVALLTTAVTQVFQFLDDLNTENDGIVRSEFVTAELRFDRASAVGDTRDAAERARSNEVWPELGRRLSTEPAIRGVTFTTGLPGTENRFGTLEIEEGVAVEGEDRRVWFSSVAPNFFDVFGLAINTGRSFTSADNVGDARSVIVNQQLAEQMFESGDPIGRRIRVAQGNTTAWVEIIGVSSDVVEINLGSRPAVLPRVYFPLGEAVGDPIHLAVHVRGDPAGLAGQLLQIAAEVEPGLVLHQPRTLEEAVGPVLTAIRLYGTTITLLAFAALVLAASGVHALLGFTVSERRREIGIRSALGAPPRRIVAAVFGRILFQLGLGTGLGVLLGLGVPGGPSGVSGLLAHTTVALGVALLGVVSCAKPLAGALRIPPTEAITAS